MTIIAPSILGADLMHLEDEIRKVERLGLPWLHFDHMDGHFVPNIAFGPAFVSAARKVTALTLDVHLMLSKPLDYIQAYADAGADGITVHVEAERPQEALTAIRARGLTAGLAINPGTPWEAALPFLPLCDLILIMTVQPGFGGQKIRTECLEKAAKLREAAAALGKTPIFEADGGINEETAGLVRDAGIDVLVMGTGLFRAAEPEAVVRRALTA